MLYFTVNIGIALILGVLIGLERELRQHPAGLRVNALVCFGSALFVSISLLLTKDTSPTRIVGQVVTGIGFLGGGVIFREGLNVHGLNTAATLWCAAAIGSLAGCGYRAEAAIGAALVLLTHIVFRPLMNFVQRHAHFLPDRSILYRLTIFSARGDADVVRAIFLQQLGTQKGLRIQSLATRPGDRDDNLALTAELFALQANDAAINELISCVGVEPKVLGVNWEQVR